MVVVKCSICTEVVTVQLTCKSLGMTHVTLGMKAYLLNDSYQSNKYSFDQQSAFQVFCKACFLKGSLIDKLMEKQPDYYQNIYNQKISEYNKIYTEPKIANLNNQVNQITAYNTKLSIKINEDTNIISSLRSQISKLQIELNQMNQINAEIKQLKGRLEQDDVCGLFKRFQSFYSDDENKMKALSACKQYCQEMSQKDPKFKSMLNDLYRQVSKDSTFHQFKQVQNFSEEHMNLLDKKIKYYQEDIKKLQWTKESMVEDCSRPSAVYKEDKIMRPEKLSELEKVFTEEIERKRQMMEALKRMRSELKIQFIHDFGEINFVTDAQMHQKSRDMARILIQV